MLPYLELLYGLWQPDSLPMVQQVIIWDVRLPYAMMAILVGGALGLAGAEMQNRSEQPSCQPVYPWCRLRCDFWRIVSYRV